MRMRAWGSLGMLFLAACGPDQTPTSADPGGAPGSLDASTSTDDAPTKSDAQGDLVPEPERAPHDSLSYGVSPDQDHELRPLEWDLRSGWKIALWFPEELRDRSRARLYGALATTDSPEIGAIVSLGEGAICTATMLGERVVVTAAHCMDCRTTTEIFGRWFAVYQDDGTVLLYRLENVVSRYPKDCTRKKPPPPEQDIALAVIRDAHVKTKLPGQFRRVAPGNVDDREVTLVGAGCVQPDTSTGRGVRRQITGAWQVFADRFVVCGGDSGGPVLDGNGNVVGLITGYYEKSKAGAFAPMSGDNLAWVQDKLARLK